MPEWMLTDEEIKQIWQAQEIERPSILEVNHQIAKAAQKKQVKWLEDKEIELAIIEDNYGSLAIQPKHFAIPIEDWEALRREVLEEEKDDKST